MELEQNVRDQLEELTRQDANVVGYNGDYQATGDGPGGERVLVYVAEATDALPPAIDTGVRTVQVETMVVGRPVVQTGGAIETAARAAATNHRTRHRPLVGGISVGEEHGSTGTLGFFVLVPPNDSPAALTAGHVLPNVGATVIQEGALDRPHDQAPGPVGAVTVTMDDDATIDAAYALLDEDMAFDRSIEGIQGAILGPAEIAVDDYARKSGRTTGVTEGIVGSVNDFVRFGPPGAPLVNVIRIDGADISEPGDSGSLWLDVGNHAVGLHYGGNDAFTVAYAYKIAHVLHQLGDVSLAL